MPKRCKRRRTVQHWTEVFADPDFVRTIPDFGRSFPPASWLASRWKTDLWLEARGRLNGLQQSSAIFLGRPHWCRLQLGSVTMDRTTGESSTALAQKVLTERPSYPSALSDSDFNGRLLATVNHAATRPLSNNASTDLATSAFRRTMMSACAQFESRRLSRLFRFVMTRRYSR